MADVLIINKLDLIGETELVKLRTFLRYVDLTHSIYFEPMQTFFFVGSLVARGPLPPDHYVAMLSDWRRYMEPNYELGLT